MISPVPVCASIIRSSASSDACVLAPTRARKSCSNVHIRTADEAYGHEGGGAGGGGGGGMGGRSGRRHLEDIVEGKLFIGGIDQDVTQEKLSNYAGGW